MDFRMRGKCRTMILAKSSGVTIEAGDLVAISSGLAIKATATSTKVAYCAKGAASAATTCEVTCGKATLIGDGSNVFAVTQRGNEYDIAVDGTSGKQTVNTSGTTYKVLMIDPSQDAGTVSSASNIKVIINKPIDEPLT